MLSGKQVLIGALLLLLARLSFFTEPYGISVDESTYMSLAEILQRGGVLYIDALDRKPPGLLWLFALFGELFGPWNIHALHVLIFGLSLGLAVLAARFSGSVWSFWLYILFSSALLRGILAANAEYWMLLFLAPASQLCIQSFLDSGPWLRRSLRLTAATFLAALACLFKQYAGFIFALIYLAGLALYLFRNQEPAAERCKVFFISSLGSLLALILVFGGCALYFYQHQALQEFLYYFAFEAFEYMGQEASELNQQTKTFWILMSLLASWLPLWFLFFYQIYSRRISAWFFLWSLGSFAALATAFFSGRHYTHYFVPVIWYLCVLLGPSAESLWLKYSTIRRLAFSIFLAVPFSVYAAVNLWQESFSSHWTFTRERQSQMKELASWIQERSEAEDLISVWGMASQIYVLAERGSGTAYVFADFVSGRLPGFKSEVSIPMPGAMENYLQQLQSRRPLFWIDTSTAKLNDYGAFPPENYPKLLVFLKHHYELDSKVAGFQVWKVKKPK